MVSKGMTDSQFNIMQTIKAFNYLLDVVLPNIESMRNTLCKNIEKLAESQSDGDEELRKSIESYYLDVFNTSIPDDMQRYFLQSLVVQIYSFVEATLKDKVANKSLTGIKDGGNLTKLERYYLLFQDEKGITLPELRTVWPDWDAFKEIRKEIVHDGGAKSAISLDYISKTISTVEQLLLEVDSK